MYHYYLNSPGTFYDNSRKHTISPTIFALSPNDPSAALLNHISLQNNLIAFKIFIMEELVQHLSFKYNISREMVKSILSTIRDFTAVNFPAFGNSLDGILVERKTPTPFFYEPVTVQPEQEAEAN